MYYCIGFFNFGEDPLCRNRHEQSVRTQTMKIAQNEIFFVGSKD